MHLPISSNGEASRQLDFDSPTDFDLEAVSGALVLGRHGSPSFEGIAAAGEDTAHSGRGLFAQISRIRFFRESLLLADPSPVAIGVWLPCLWTFIGFVSAVDTYLSAKYSYFLKAMEINPLGRWLIIVDGGDTGLLLGTKFFCNLLVISVLILSHRWYSRLCWVLTLAMSLMQLWLLGFLFLS